MTVFVALSGKNLKIRNLRYVLSFSPFAIIEAPKLAEIRCKLEVFSVKYLHFSQCIEKGLVGKLMHMPNFHIDQYSK